MPITLPSEAWAKLSPVERNKLLAAAFAEKPAALKYYILTVDARIRVYETRYEMPSSQLPDALSSGRLTETADVSQWLFWTGLRSRFARKARTKPAR